MVRLFRSVPHTGAISEPEPRPLRLHLWHLEALLTPGPLDALVVDTPPFVAQDGSDPQVPIPTIFLSQRHDSVAQSVLIIEPARDVLLSCSTLPNHPTGPALRHGQDGLRLLDRFPPSDRAQKFPAVTSFKMLLSRERSATSRFNRAFSCSRPFNRLA